MADMKEVYDDLIIINLYLNIKSMVSNIHSIFGDYQTWQQFPALSFYRYKLFWMHPNWFGVGQVQNVLDQTQNNFSLLNFTF